MTRRSRLLIALLAVGVVCAGVGVAFTRVTLGAASFGWTAYAPLSGESYVPINVTWLTWAPRIGVALLAIGAGSAGAAVSALVLLTRASEQR